MSTIQRASAVSFKDFAADQPFALYRGREISRGRLWADVRLLAQRLPDRPYQFNLCENRYHFCVYLLAALSRGQLCLLPPSNQPGVIEEIASHYPGAYLGHDGEPIDSRLASFRLEVLGENGDDGEAMDFDWQHATVIAFTSGSTGHPKACPHNLDTFRISATMAINSLGLQDRQWLMLSTTPPQHMYGLETSVFWPLFSRLMLHDARPFFAEDIRREVAAAPWPVMLTSTPAHLRVLQNAAGDWSSLAGVLSATDELGQALAERIAAALGRAPREIYGSTETLSFAWRETLREKAWQPYADSFLHQDKLGRTWLQTPHLPRELALQDAIALGQQGRFELQGRPDDMIKIAGKRASLAELNRRLNQIDGVEDGFFYRRSDGRLVAVVVSQLDKQTIRASLAPFIDAVFLPRQIHFVPGIARNATGKLLKSQRDQLLALLERTAS